MAISNLTTEGPRGRRTDAPEVLEVRKSSVMPSTLSQLVVVPQFPGHRGLPEQV
jgi:hypothetical protein